jgi:hypothetical protein
MCSSVSTIAEAKEFVEVRSHSLRILITDAYSIFGIVL